MPRAQDKSYSNISLALKVYEGHGDSTLLEGGEVLGIYICL